MASREASAAADGQRNLFFFSRYARIQVVYVEEGYRYHLPKSPNVDFIITTPSSTVTVLECARSAEGRGVAIRHKSVMGLPADRPDAESPVEKRAMTRRPLAVSNRPLRADKAQGSERTRENFQ